MKRFGCIADDFTGATDLAAMLARRGWRVSLSDGVPDADVDLGDAHVVALKSRTIAPDRAVEQSLKACRFLVGVHGAQAIYFKYCSTFDSTDKGNIGPVLDALMAELGVDRTIAAPAFPENGRRVFLGHLFVNGRLLSESSLASHPLTPMTDPDLVRVLGQQRHGHVDLISVDDIGAGAGAVSAKFDTATPGTVFICDATSNGEMEQLAAGLPAMRLASGGSAMGAAIAGRAAISSALDWSRTRTPPRALLLSGSASQQTQRQVRRAIESGRPVIKVSPQEMDEPQALARSILERLDAAGKAPLVYSTASPQEVAQMQQHYGREAAGERVERFFACLAWHALTRGFDTFVVAGGETSGAVAQALGAKTMLVGPEIAPGVPWMSSNGIRLALKSGNFGGDDFFADALESLEMVSA